MKMPISMFCPLPPELAALAGADDVAEADELLPLSVSLLAALLLFQVLTPRAPW